MIISGVMYKRGHMRKNWTMRLFVLDGGKCSCVPMLMLAMVLSGETCLISACYADLTMPNRSHRYFELGNSVPKGDFELAQVTSAVREQRKSGGLMQKTFSAGVSSDDADLDRKPWKKFTMVVQLGPKLDYILCPPDEPSLEVWLNAFNPCERELFVWGY
jgi:hypothetical protein